MKRVASMVGALTVVVGTWARAGTPITGLKDPGPLSIGLKVDGLGLLAGGFGGVEVGVRVLPFVRLVADAEYFGGNDPSFSSIGGGLAAGDFTGSTPYVLFEGEEAFWGNTSPGSPGPPRELLLRAMGGYEWRAATAPVSVSLGAGAIWEANPPPPPPSGCLLCGVDIPYLPDVDLTVRYLF